MWMSAGVSARALAVDRGKRRSDPLCATAAITQSAPVFQTLSIARKNRSVFSFKCLLWFKPEYLILVRKDLRRFGNAKRMKNLSYFLTQRIENNSSP